MKSVLAFWLLVAITARVLTLWVDVPVVAHAATHSVMVGTPLMVGGHWAMFPALPAHGRCYRDPVIVTRWGREISAAEYLKHETASPRVVEGFLGPCS